jgi:nucleotide-binding universal stress UspA family protein
VALVVGYDAHPASRAALVFAGDLGGALNIPVHVVHVVDSDVAGAPNATEQRFDAERQHIGDALDSAGVQWQYHLVPGDPVDALLQAADDHAASMLVVGRPEQGIGAAVGHLVTGAVARNLVRRSHRPVVVVPEFISSRG